MATGTRDVMTVEQVAEHLQVTADQVRRLIEERGLPALRLFDDVWRVSRPVLDRWIERESLGHIGERAPLRTMTRDQVRQLRDDTYAGRARGLTNAPRLTKEFLDRTREIREAVLADRGGKPFPKGWIHDAIEEGRL